ncbi:MAG: OmpA family protein [Rhodobacteraceae bacterium]|nr:OmpA family protein [Paracoccaceae bacterium]
MTMMQRAPVGRSRIGPAFNEMQEQLGLALGLRSLQSGPPQLRARRQRVTASRAYAPPASMFRQESLRLVDLRRVDLRSRPRRALMALGVVSMVASCAVVDGGVRHTGPYLAPQSAEHELFAMALEEQFLAKAHTAFTNEVFEDATYFASRARLVDAVSLPQPPEPVMIGLPTSHPRWREAMSMRQRLMIAIKAGARQSEPQLAASAQADYECWLRGVKSQLADPAHVAIASACHQGVLRALSTLNGAKTRVVAVAETKTPATPAAEQVSADRPELTIAADTATPVQALVQDAVANERALVGGAYSTSYRPSQKPAQISQAAVVRTPLDRTSLAQLAVAARPVDGDYAVFFERGSTSLTREAESNLRIFISDVAHRDMRSIVLYSHSDTSGSSALNRRLSVMRAKTVRQFLRRRLGTGVEIDIRAFGETRPPVATPDGVDEALNRRVELRLEG